MSRFDNFPDRALELASTVGDRLRKAVPAAKAGGLLEAGVAMGALKTGTRVARVAIRRHPVMAVAAIAGAGLLWYAARRKARQAESAPIEGSAKRIEAKKRTSARTAGTRSDGSRAASHAATTSSAAEADAS